MRPSRARRPPTLKALQTERELAERIERSIKLLRSKTAAASADAERQESA